MISTTLLLVTSASLLARSINAEKNLPNLTYNVSCTEDQRSSMQNAYQLATDQLDLVLSFKDGAHLDTSDNPNHMLVSEAQDLRTRYFGKNDTSESIHGNASEYLHVFGKPPNPSRSRPAHSALTHTSEILAY